MGKHFDCTALNSGNGKIDLKRSGSVCVETSVIPCTTGVSRAGAFCVCILVADGCAFSGACVANDWPYSSSSSVLLTGGPGVYWWYDGWLCWVSCMGCRLYVWSVTADLRRPALTTGLVGSLCSYGDELDILPWASSYWKRANSESVLTICNSYLRSLTEIK